MSRSNNPVVEMATSNRDLLPLSVERTQERRRAKTVGQVSEAQVASLVRYKKKKGSKPPPQRSARATLLGCHELTTKALWRACLIEVCIAWHSVLLLFLFVVTFLLLHVNRL